MEKTRVLIVDDDPNINQLIKLYLEKEGYETDTAMRGDEALNQFKKNPPHIVLLDLMLPGMDGWQVCREIRKISTIPIIMLTAKDETFDKVLGLELGADDYMTKPFDPQGAHCAHQGGDEKNADRCGARKGACVPQSCDQHEHLSCHLQRQRDRDAAQGDRAAVFPCGACHKVFTRDQLLEHVWGFDYFGDSRTVDVHVKRIREKLPECEQYGWHIKTIWSVGYKFEVK